MHQTYATLKEKVDQWPLRILYLRLIETIGRVVVFLIVVVYFIKMISPNESTKVIMYSISFIICISTACRELFGLRSATFLSLHNLLEKVKNPSTTVADISSIETLVFNIWKFKTLSLTKVHISEFVWKFAQDSPDTAVKETSERESNYRFQSENSTSLKSLVDFKNIYGISISNRSDKVNDQDNGLNVARMSGGVELTTNPLTKNHIDIETSTRQSASMKEFSFNNSSDSDDEDINI